MDTETSQVIIQTDIIVSQEDISGIEYDYLLVINFLQQVQKCSQIILTPSSDFEDSLKQIKESREKLLKQKFHLAIVGFQNFFKLDMMFFIDQEIRNMRGIKYISFTNCVLTVKHLKILREYIKGRDETPLTLIFSMNNFSWDCLNELVFQDKHIQNMIKKKQLGLFINNNIGLFINFCLKNLREKCPLVMIDSEQFIISMNVEFTNCREFQKINFVSVDTPLCFVDQRNVVYESALQVLFEIDQISKVRQLNISAFLCGRIEIAAQIFYAILQSNNLLVLRLRRMKLQAFTAFYQRIAMEQKYLVLLDISQSQVSYEGLQKILQNTVAQQLILQKLKFVQESGMVDISQIQTTNLNELIQLNLSENSQFSVRNWHIVGEMIGSYQNLQKISLVNCALNDLKCAEISAGFEIAFNRGQNRILKIIQFDFSSNTDIQKHGWTKMNFIFQYCRQLKIFKSNNCELSTYKLQVFIDYLCECQVFECSGNAKTISSLDILNLYRQSKSHAFAKHNDSPPQAIKYEINFSEAKEGDDMNRLEQIQLSLKVNNNKMRKKSIEGITFNYLYIQKLKEIKLEGYQKLQKSRFNEENIDPLADLIQLYTTQAKNLSKLCIENCFLGELTVDCLVQIFKKSNLNSNLTELKLNQNSKLTPIMWKDIFESICNLLSLQQLSIEYSMLDQGSIHFITFALGSFNNIKAQISIQETLKELSFQGNRQIDNHSWALIFRSLQKYDKIKRLNISACQLLDEGIQEVSDQLKNSVLEKSLLEFIFNNNEILESKGWGILMSSFSKYQRLQIIETQHCHLDDEQVQTIIQAFFQSSKLKQNLKIWKLDGNADIEAQGWKKIFSFLRQCKKLLSIDIQDCYWNNQIAKAAIEGYFQNTEQQYQNESLHSFRMKRNEIITTDVWQQFFQRFIGNRLFHEIEVAKQNFKFIQQLNTCRNRMSSIHSISHQITKLTINKNYDLSAKDWGFFFCFLGNIQTLQEISLEYCSLNDQKVLSIVNALSEKNFPLIKNLTQLSFRCNKYIRQKGWFEFFSLFTNFTNLYCLELQSCNITDSIIKNSFIVHFDMLKHLKTFNFFDNQNITTAGWSAFFSSIDQNCETQEVIMNSCNIRDETLTMIAEQIERRGNLFLHLKSIDLSRNYEISDRGWDIFFMGIGKLQSLQCLQINFCYFSDSKIQGLIKSLNYSHLLWESFHQLELSGNSRISHKYWNLIFKGLSQVKALKCINLAACNLTSDILKDFFSIVSTKELKKIQLSANSFNDFSGWLDLSLFIAGTKNLECLELTACQLTTYKINHLFEQVQIKSKIKTSLKFLSLSGNFMDQFDWVEIMNQFQTFQKISKLSLRNCKLKDDYLNAIIGEIYPDSPLILSLEEILLSGNNDLREGSLVPLITNIGRYSVAAKRVDLKGCQVDVLLTQKFIDVLKNQKEFQNYEFLIETDNNQANQCLSLTILPFDTQFNCLYSLPKHYGQKIFKLNQYFLQATQLQIEPSLLSQNDAQKIGLFPLSMLNDHFLKYYCEDSNELVISTCGLKWLSGIFSYDIDPMELNPFPYRVIFNSRVFQNFPSHIQKIKIITNSQLNETEFISYELLRDIYYQFRLKSNLQIVYLDYSLTNQIIDQFFTNFNESNLVKFMNFLPPRRILFDHSLSLSAWKAIYTINLDSYHFSKANMNYSVDSFLNVGIALSLRERFNAWKFSNFFLFRIFKKIIYIFLSFFVQTPPKYQFFPEQKVLNEQLGQNTQIFYTFLILSIVYYVSLAIYPYLIMKEALDQGDCHESSSIEVHIFYIMMAFITAILELSFVWFILKIIGTNYPDYFTFKKERRLSRTVNFKPNQQQKKANYHQSMILRRYLRYSKLFIFGQISRYNLFIHILFMFKCFNCHLREIAFYFLVFNIIIFLWNIRILINLLIQKRSQKGTPNFLTSYYINQFYKLASPLNFQIVMEILDVLSPYNVSTIPNNCFTRFFFNEFVITGINNQLLNYIISFSIKHFPQLVLGIYVLNERESFQLDHDIILSLFLNVTMFVVSFFNIISVRPSTITQLTFNQISKRVQSKYLEETDQLFNQQISQFENWQIKYIKEKQQSLNVINGEISQMIENPQKSTIKVSRGYDFNSEDMKPIKADLLDRQQIQQLTKSSRSPSKKKSSMDLTQENINIIK